MSIRHATSIALTLAIALSLGAPGPAATCPAGPATGSKLGDWEWVYGAEYTGVSDFRDLAARGMNTIHVDFGGDPSDWEKQYQAAIACGLKLIPVLWVGGSQTAWEWNVPAGEWELSLARYPKSTGAKFLQFLRDHPTYLRQTLAVYSFHEPLNSEAPESSRVSPERMRKFWLQIHQEEFPDGNVKVYGQDIAWNEDCRNGVVDYDYVALYPFAICGLSGEQQYRPSVVIAEGSSLTHYWGDCSTDREAAMKADREYIEAFHRAIEAAPAAPDGSRTRLMALIQTFAYDRPEMEIWNRMPSAAEMHDWALKVVLPERDKLAGAFWYPFRFGSGLYDFDLATARYDGTGADRWEVIDNAGKALLSGQPILSDARPSLP